MIATERLYAIRRPLSALLAGASVASLGGDNLGENSHCLARNAPES